jgi:hypothetical protein
MGLQKIYKQIEQGAKNLPPVVRNGVRINHVRLMKRIHKVEGMTGVNKYIKQIFYEDQLEKIKSKQDADRLAQPDTEVSVED